MSVILTVAYIMYVVLTIMQLVVLLYNDFAHGKVSWWTLIYPTVVTGAVVAFNWEFSLLVGLYERPADMAIVWVAFILLAVCSYWAYAYYPYVRRNPFWKSCYGWR